MPDTPRKKAPPSTALAIANARAAVIRKDQVQEDIYATWLRSLSDLSAINYKRDLVEFADWLGLAGDAQAGVAYLMGCKDGAEANRLAHGFLTHLSEQAYADATISRRYYALRSVTKLARLFGIIDWRIEVKPPAARQKMQDTAGCGPEGFRTLMACLEDELIKHSTSRSKRAPRSAAALWRDRAYICLLYYAALRRKEPLTIMWPDGVRVDKYEVLIKGKARRSHEWAPCGKAAMTAILEYVDVRGDHDGFLFCSPGVPTKAVSVQAMGKRFQNLAKLAGVDTTPHGLRHAAITEYLERSDGDIRTAQRFARHSSPTVTMVYDDNRRLLASRAIETLEEEDD